MASRRNRTVNMPAPYLKRVWFDPTRVEDREAYPFCLPFLLDDFELSFDRPITIIAGEISFTSLTPASGRQDHTASPSAEPRSRQ